MRNFAQNGGLQKLQELKVKATEKIKTIIIETPIPDGISTYINKLTANII